MKNTTKIFLASLIIFLIFIASLCGIGLYYYRHPGAVKAFIEKSIARSANTSCTIKNLSYSLKPLRLRAEGIVCEPSDNHHGFHLKVPELTVDMALDGVFGNRNLIIKTFKMNGFSCRISHDMVLPKIEEQSDQPSFFSRILKRALAFFLFRNIKFEAAHITNGHLVAKTQEQTFRITNINGWLNKKHLVTISCGAVFLWPAREMRFTAPQLLITTDHQISLVDPELSFLLTTIDAVFQSPGIDIQAMGLTAKTAFNHKKYNLTIESADLNCDRVLLQESGVSIEKVESKLKVIYDLNCNKLILKSAHWFMHGVIFEDTFDREPLPLDINLTTQGSWNLSKSALELSDFDLVISDITKLEGQGEIRLGIETAVMLKISNGSFFLQKMLPFISPGLRKQLKPITLSGPAFLKGTVRGMKQNNSWDLDGDIRVQLKGNRLSYANERMRISSDITGCISAQGKLPDIEITAHMYTDQSLLSSKLFAAKKFQMGLTISGTYPVFEINEFNANIPRTWVKMGEKDILIADTYINSTKGTIDAKKQSIDIPEIQLESSLLQNLLLSLTIDGTQLAVAMKGEQTNILESAQDLNMIPAGWQISGIDTFQVKATQRQTNIWAFIAELGFHNLTFENKDSTCIGEKISLKARTSGEIDLNKPSVTTKTNLEINEGEALYDHFYMDLGRHAFTCYGDAVYDPPKKILRLSTMKVGINDIMGCHMHGNIRNTSLDQTTHLSIHILKAPLKPLFKHFVVDPFKIEKPILADLTIGGDLSGDLELEGNNKTWKIRGHLLWHGGKLLSADHDFSIRGIDLDLPVCYRSHKDFKKTETATGNLSIQSMKIPMLPDQPITMRVDAGLNSLSIPSPTIIKIPGGSVRIGPISCKNIFGNQASIHSNLSMKAVKIHPLLSKFRQRPVQGKIDGELDSITCKGGNLTTEGKIIANAFDGEIIFSDLGATGIFGSTPLFRMNVRINALRLAEMTSGTQFGKIDGVLHGYVKDLEVAHGQPQKFNLLLETIPTNSVSQRISVKALDNIARIGKGQSAFVGLAAGFAKIFKEFPYQKIGVRASLENDVFRINGTIREEDKEYIIKKGGILGVDIVNQNPDNRAGFKDMVKRIKRVIADRGAPIIK